MGRCKKVKMYFLHPALPLDSEDLGALREAQKHLRCRATDPYRGRDIRLAVVFIPDRFRCSIPSRNSRRTWECRRWVVNDRAEASAVRRRYPRKSDIST